MSDQQRLRPACAYAQSDQSLCLSLEYSMSVKLLSEQRLEFLSYMLAVQAHLSPFMSKCHIVGNLMSRLSYIWLYRLFIPVLHQPHIYALYVKYPKIPDIKKKYNLLKTLFIQHFTFDGAFIMCFLALSKHI